MAPILPSRFQQLLDQQAAKAGAVDEQIAFDPFARLQAQGGDMAAFAVLLGIEDAALDTPRAMAFGEGAQESGVTAGIEVIGIIDVRLVGGGEALGFRRLQLEAIGAKLVGQALLARAQPDMVEVGHPGRPADLAEAVEIAIADPRPILEGYAQLEGRSGRLHEVAFVDAEQMVEGPRRRDGRFADADGADLVGFDQHHIEQRLEQFGQGGRDHPSGGTAPGDDDPLDLLLHFNPLADLSVLPVREADGEGDRA